MTFGPNRPALHRRLVLALGLGAAAVLAGPAGAAQMSGRTAWTFSFDGLEGGPIRLGDHAGKPVMVVNTASFCGFASQFDTLQALWNSHGPRGLLLVGVPSGDFGGQEASTAAETRAVVVQHGITFPMAAKARVTGPQAHPFYRVRHRGGTSTNIWWARMAGWRPCSRPRSNQPIRASLRRSRRSSQRQRAADPAMTP